MVPSRNREERRERDARGSSPVPKTGSCGIRLRRQPSFMRGPRYRPVPSRRMTFLRILSFPWLSDTRGPALPSRGECQGRRRAPPLFFSVSFSSNHRLERAEKRNGTDGQHCCLCWIFLLTWSVVEQCVTARILLWGISLLEFCSKKMLAWIVISCVYIYIYVCIS